MIKDTDIHQIDNALNQFVLATCVLGMLGDMDPIKADQTIKQYASKLCSHPASRQAFEKGWKFIKNSEWDPSVEVLDDNI